jgi:hypothetical protein
MTRIPMQSFRCPTEVWQAAQAKAMSEKGISLAEFLRRSLTAYVSKTPALS